MSYLVLDAIVLFFAVPVSMWNLRTLKQDKLTLAWIIPWSLLLFIGISPHEILLFGLGVIVGYFTDIAGVFAKRWWYPHYSSRLYSLSAGYGWGIITLIIFRIYFFIMENLENFLGWGLLGIFLFLWIGVERVKGKTSFSNPWLVTRTILAVLFLLVSEDIFFLFVAAAGAVYLEVLGTTLRIWIYYDESPSYLHLGAGYAQLSYICLLVANMMVTGVLPSIPQIFLFVILIALYVIDYSGIKLTNRPSGMKKTKEMELKSMAADS